MAKNISTNTDTDNNYDNLYCNKYIFSFYLFITKPETQLCCNVHSVHRISFDHKASNLVLIAGNQFVLTSIKKNGMELGEDAKDVSKLYFKYIEYTFQTQNETPIVSTRSQNYPHNKHH